MWICKMCETSNEDQLTRCSACGAAKAEKIWTPPNTEKPPIPETPPEAERPPIPETPPIQPPEPRPDLYRKVWGHTWFYYLLRWFTSISLLLCPVSIHDQEYWPLALFIVLRLLMFFACSIESSSGRFHIPFLDTHNDKLISQAQASAARWFMILCWGAYFVLLAALFSPDLSYELEDTVGTLLVGDILFFAPLSDFLFDKVIYAHLQNTRS